MIETASEGAAAATLSSSDALSEQAPAPATGAPGGVPEAPRRPRTSRQDVLLRQLPPAPKAEQLQRLSVAALRDLLRANGVELAPQARKATLRAAVLRLVADPGSTIRLPDGLSRASDGVAGAPAFSPDPEGPGDDAALRTSDAGEGRAAPTKPPGGADHHTRAPPDVLQRPVNGPGRPAAAPGLTAELPPMPHCASDYPADPDHRKLSAAVLAALEDLPLRPSENQLRGAKFAGLQVLLKANGLPRPNYASVESMTH